MSGKQSADTARALRLVAKGATPYSAARKTRIALSTIYRALRKMREQKTPMNQ